jgi:hypothetical protein
MFANDSLRGAQFLCACAKKAYLISGTTFGGARFILGAVASNLTHPLQSRGHGRH